MRARNAGHQFLPFWTSLFGSCKTKFEGRVAVSGCRRSMLLFGFRIVWFRRWRRELFSWLSRCWRGHAKQGKVKDLGSGLRLARSSEAVTEGSIFVSSVSWSISSVVFSSVAVVGIVGLGMASPPEASRRWVTVGLAVLFIAISNNVLGGIAPVTRKRLSSVFKIKFRLLESLFCGVNPC